MQESQDVARAEENVQALQKQLADLDAEFQDELSKLDLRSDASSEKLETILIRPKKTDVKPRLVALAWDAGE
jgi:alkylhydroperoxidase/carboxymuconolactone decarboxylase family protein YurZ